MDRSSVGSQIGAVSVGGVAQGAYERLLTRMNVHVLFQFVHFGEALVAMVTPVRSICEKCIYVTHFATFPYIKNSYLASMPL